MEGKKRYIELLRVIGCICVVGIHTSAMAMGNDLMSQTWMICYIFDCVYSCFGVGIFIMISGSLWLQTEKEFKLVNKLIRFVKLYIGSAFFYGAFNWTWANKTFDLPEIIKAGVIGIEAPEYHLWYLMFMVGIIIFTPIIKAWIGNGEEKSVVYRACYIMAIWILVDILSVNLMIWQVGGANHIYKMILMLKIPSTVGWWGYYVLGYICDNVEITKRWVYIICVVALCLLFISCMLCVENSRINGSMISSYCNQASITCIMCGISIWFWAKSVKYIPDIVTNISKYTLGVYILHPCILKITSGVIVPLIQEYEWLLLVIPLMILSICCILIIFVKFLWRCIRIFGVQKLCRFKMIKRRGEREC